jgi:hypothetical protein
MVKSNIKSTFVQVLVVNQIIIIVIFLNTERRANSNRDSRRNSWAEVKTVLYYTTSLMDYIQTVMVFL